jgi:hypothetical protein
MAAEANPSLFHQSAIVILARQAALKQIKQQRKRLGLRETLPIGLGGDRRKVGQSDPAPGRLSRLSWSTRPGEEKHRRHPASFSEHRHQRLCAARARARGIVSEFPTLWSMRRR